MTHEHITADPRVMFGKPVIRGTRITVEHLLRKLAAGLSVADVIEAHPHLTEADVHAALAYAADYMGHEAVLPASP